MADWLATHLPEVTEEVLVRDAAPGVERRSKVPLIIADAPSEGLPLSDGASGAPGLPCPSIAKASTEFTQSRQDHQKDCGHKRKGP